MSRSTSAEQRAPRSLKERQREERGALILEAAHDLLAEKGYHEASLEEIAARVGISKATVYLHFASKEDLVAALIERQIIEFMALIDQVAAEQTSVRARLEQILTRTYSGLGGKRAQVLLELDHSIGLTRSLIEKRAELKARTTQATARITALFEQGQRSGELDPSLPTPIMVATFVGLLSLRGYEQLLSSSQVTPAELVAHVGRIFFQGIAAPLSAA